KRRPATSVRSPRPPSDHFAAGVAKRILRRLRPGALPRPCHTKMPRPRRRWEITIAIITRPSMSTERIKRQSVSYDALIDNFVREVGRLLGKSESASYLRDKIALHRTISSAQTGGRHRRR